ncbi:uncharacterized protein LOC118274379 [Spodoptera frugiperda]|uniref:Uncharacterized protein LOC118274379 n=1 Tax=Spodoptera frugiperda TaxID=7108 RepID=A0A9R0EDX9_SPOFR|nr:uncharacterized protein LOC118274379 [Spodoptera frugiperda]
MEKSKNKTFLKPPSNEEERASELSSLAVAGESRSGSVSLGPVRAPSRRVSGSESDSSSASGACSLRSVSSQRPKRGTFKRPRLEEGRGPSSNEQEAPAPKIPTASRGRGKRKGSERLVPTTQAEPTEADSSEMEVSGGEGSVGQNIGVTGEVSLRKAVMEALRMVAGQKSQNARNGVLRHAKATIMKAARQNGAPLAAGRQMTALQKELGEMRREMARLTASNAAMEAELRSAKAELAAARGGRGQPSQSTEADMIDLVRREMAAFQQRFDVLEGRILRPPLAASQRAPKTFAAAAATNSGQSSRSAQGQPPARELVASPAQAPAAPAAKAPIGRRRRGTVNQPAVAPTGVEPTPVSDSPVDGGQWHVVGEPDAVKRGVTYGDVLAKLKAAVNPAEYGAPDGFSMKVTATGARLLEVPGEASGPSADALAERLRACLGTDEARVSRPTKICSPPAKARGKARPSATPAVPAAATAVATASPTAAVAAAAAGCNAAEEVVMDCQ